MDIINQEKKYPTLVEVVNDPKNPTEVIVKNLPTNSAGTRLIVDASLSGTAANVGYQVRPTSGNYNVHVDSLFLVDSSTGSTVVVPLGSNYYNLTPAQITSMENGFHNLNLLYPATTTAYVIYSKLSNQAVSEQIVYSLQ